MQPVNVATPEAVRRASPPLQANVPPASFTVSDSVTTRPLVVTVLPPASWRATTGCVDHAPPPVPPPGCAVKPSRTGAPAVIVKTALVADCRPGELAVSV